MDPVISCLCCFVPIMIVWAIVGFSNNSKKAEDTKTPYLHGSEYRPSYSPQTASYSQPVPAQQHPVTAIPFQAATYQTDIHLKPPTNRSLTEVIEQSKRLQDLDLSFQHLREIHFSGCELVEINMTGANLIEVSFSGGRLQNVNFDGAFLTGADFSKASLQNVNFFNCDLSGVNFKEAEIRNSSFDQADLTRAEFLDSRIEDCSFTGSLKTRALNLQD